MSNVPVFVGLDYHQDSIQVCALDAAGKGQRVGIEACCGAADLGQQLVEQLGWNVSHRQARELAVTDQGITSAGTRSARG
jgi:hypothetical protein